MPPTPSPAPLAPAPLEWWQNVALFSPAAVLLAALVAALINWRILRQRTKSDAAALDQKREADRHALEQKTAADNRAEWWKRAQWALEQAVSDDEDTRALGLATLDVLAHSELARKEELELFDIAWEVVNAPPYAVQGGELEGPQESTIYIEIPDNNHLDLQNLGQYLRQQAELFHGGLVDSGNRLGRQSTDGAGSEGGRPMSAHTSEPKATHTRRITVKTSAAPTASQRRVQVAAARLRITLDQRLGRTTPAADEAK